MKKLSLTLLAASLFCFAQNLQAQEKSKKTFTLSSSADASMFQIALTDIGGQSDISTLRYSYFWNGGTDVNYKINNGLTLFSGVRIHNLGLILKTDSSTNKYRTYSAGIPLGLKIKTGEKQNLIIGGGIDFPFNYKVKSWVNGRENKVKENEWFSDKVNQFMPYATLGYNLNPLVVKLMYFPNNFWNSDHPLYVNSSANLVVLTVGFNLNKNDKSDGKSFKFPRVEEAAE